MESTIALSSRGKRQRQVTSSSQARRMTMQAVQLLALNTRSFLAFHSDQRIVAMPAEQTRESTCGGRPIIQMEKRPVGIVTPIRSQSSAATAQSKNRWCPVSAVGQAAQRSDGAQPFICRFTRVLSLSMAAR